MSEFKNEFTFFYEFEFQLFLVHHKKYKTIENIEI